MGLLFDDDIEEAENVEAAPAIAEPGWGISQKTTLLALIQEASNLTSYDTKQALYQAINDRYRSKAYRDYYKEMVDKGHANIHQQNEMQSLLSSIRHCKRTPRAKAYRYMWP